MEISIAKEQLRNFGLIVGSVFVLVFGLTFPFFRGAGYNMPSIVLGGSSIAAAIIAPSILKWPYVVWLRVGHVMGVVNSHIILSVIYFVLFSSVGLYRRLMGKDTLQQKLNPAILSYRVASKAAPRLQFRRMF